METATRFYGELVSYDIKIQRNHGQIDEFAMVVFVLVRCPIYCLESVSNLMSIKK